MQKKEEEVVVRGTFFFLLHKIYKKINISEKKVFKFKRKKAFSLVLFIVT